MQPYAPAQSIRCDTYSHDQLRYNLAGEVTTMTYPSGRVVKQNYDAIGRLQSVQNNATRANYVSGIAYNAANQVTGFSYGNAVSASYGYSAQRLQLTSLVYAPIARTKKTRKGLVLPFVSR